MLDQSINQKVTACSRLRAILTYKIFSNECDEKQIHSIGIIIQYQESIIIVILVFHHYFCIFSLLIRCVVVSTMCKSLSMSADQSDRTASGLLGSENRIISSGRSIFA